MLSGSNTSQGNGVWEPLPLIVYGYAVHPLSPSRRDTRYSGRTRLSTVTEGSSDDILHRDVVSLEVGDEVYAFEKFTPKAKEADGVWYRGYAYLVLALTTGLAHIERNLDMWFAHPADRPSIGQRPVTPRAPKAPSKTRTRSRSS